jgi:conjugal transfer pilin signal peptidase TrbI
MYTLKKVLKPFLTLLFIVVNGYCLINIATHGTYCQHFRINVSDSLPYYIFTASPLDYSENIERGAYVSLSHDLSVRDLLKQVVGLPGDKITVRDQHIFINDHEYGFIHEISPSGLPLSPIDEEIIPEDHVFVHATHPQSFDSRYMRSLVSLLDGSSRRRYGPFSNLDVIGLTIFLFNRI